MKYAGNVTIFKDGEMIFDRELTSDEIIDALISNKALGTVPPPQETDEKPEPPAAPKKRGRPRKENSEKASGRGHDCCGSKGPRHKKDCPAKENLSSPGNRKVVGRQPFSEATYSMVKNKLDDGTTVDEVVYDKGLNLLEVRRVNLADSYEEYLEIA